LRHPGRNLNELGFNQIQSANAGKSAAAPSQFFLLFTIFDRFQCCQRLEAVGNSWNEMPK
jgi:hypothetical protein